MGSTKITLNWNTFDLCNRRDVIWTVSTKKKYQMFKKQKENKKSYFQTLSV